MTRLVAVSLRSFASASVRDGTQSGSTKVDAEVNHARVSVIASSHPVSVDDGVAIQVSDFFENGSPRSSR